MAEIIDVGSIGENQKNEIVRRLNKIRRIIKKDKYFDELNEIFGQLNEIDSLVIKSRKYFEEDNTFDEVLKRVEDLLLIFLDEEDIILEEEVIDLICLIDPSMEEEFYDVEEPTRIQMLFDALKSFIGNARNAIQTFIKKDKENDEEFYDLIDENKIDLNEIRRIIRFDIASCLGNGCTNNVKIKRICNELSSIECDKPIQNNAKNQMIRILDSIKNGTYKISRDTVIELLDYLRVMRGIVTDKDYLKMKDDEKKKFERDIRCENVAKPPENIISIADYRSKIADDNNIGDL